MSFGIDSKQIKSLKLTDEQFNALDALDGSADNQIDKSIFTYAKKYRLGRYKNKVYNINCEPTKESQVVDIMSTSRTFDEKNNLLRVSCDRNHDNVIDIVQDFYENGDYKMRISDDNFDGKMDQKVEFYKGLKKKKLVQRNNGAIEIFYFNADGTTMKRIGTEADLKLF